MKLNYMRVLYQNKGGFFRILYMYSVTHETMKQTDYVCIVHMYYTCSSLHTDSGDKNNSSDALSCDYLLFL